jgi:hypothetical protein
MSDYKHTIEEGLIGYAPGFFKYSPTICEQWNYPNNKGIVFFSWKGKYQMTNTAHTVCIWRRKENKLNSGQNE